MPNEPICRIRSMGVVLISLIVLATTSGAWAETVLEDHWYSASLAGAKVGSMNVRAVADATGDVTYATTLEMSMNRGATEVSLTVSNRWLETREGRPLEASLIQDMSMMKQETTWRFEDGQLVISESAGGGERTRTQPLTRDRWLTPYSATKYFQERAARGEDTIAVRTMSPEIGPKVVTTTYTRQGTDRIEIAGRLREASVWNMVNDATPGLVTKLWLSRDGVNLVTEVDLGMGVMRMELVDRATAGGKAEELPEVFYKLLVEPDRPIEDPWRARRAILEVRLTTEGDTLDLPSVGAQTIAGTSPGTVTIVVDREGAQPALPEEVEDPAFREASVMIDSEDEVVRALHRQATGSLAESSTPRDRAEAMRAFVNRHIDDKNLATAFASASEVARTGAGDCSEHGVLLAALLRADGIPSRVVTGLVYMPGIGERGEGAFGWHMWTQAMIDGQWMDLDATLPVWFSVGHITTGTSSLAEGTGVEDMAAIIGKLGKIQIDVVRIDPE